MLTQPLEKVKESLPKTGEVKNAIREQIAGYLTAAFGLVAGLAWNDAIKALIEYIFPVKQNTLLAKFIYAIIMTLIVVMASVYIIRLLKKKA